MMDQQRVTRVCVDYGVVLLTEDGTELRLTCPFSFADGDDKTAIDLDPTELGVNAGVVVGLIHQAIDGVEIDDTGRLRLRLSGGGLLTCWADARYEAWTLTLSTREMFISQPGGGVAHWPPAID